MSREVVYAAKIYFNILGGKVTHLSLKVIQFKHSERVCLHLTLMMGRFWNFLSRFNTLCYNTKCTF